MFYNVHYRVMGGNLESEMNYKAFSVARVFLNLKENSKFIQRACASAGLFDTTIFAIDVSDLNTI